MSVVYLNGQYCDENKAVVSINDAGYYYGDGVYEYIFKYNNKLIDIDGHLDRLIASLEKAYIKNYPSKQEIINIIEKLINHNPDIQNGGIYLQITRGIATRTHSFFKLNLQPSIMAKILPAETDFKTIQKLNCHIVEDPRRIRRDIKMLSLMPMVISKYEVEKEGYDEVLYYNSQVNSVTEGCSFNVFIVDKDNTLITAPLGKELLAGITRNRLIKIAKANGYKIEERYYTKQELYTAKEVFSSDSGNFISSIVKVDNNIISNSEIGETTNALYQKYIEFVKE